MTGLPNFGRKVGSIDFTSQNLLLLLRPFILFPFSVITYVHKHKHNHIHPKRHVIDHDMTGLPNFGRKVGSIDFTSQNLLLLLRPFILFPFSVIT